MCLYCVTDTALQSLVILRCNQACIIYDDLSLDLLDCKREIFSDNLIIVEHPCEKNLKTNVQKLTEVMSHFSTTLKLRLSKKLFHKLNERKLFGMKFLELTEIAFIRSTFYTENMRLSHFFRLLYFK